MLADRPPRFTRVAVVQLPHNLVEQHVPPAVLGLDLPTEASDRRAGQLLVELQAKLDELHLEVWRLAEAQALSHLESVLSFCGCAGREVDIVVLPDVLPYTWLHRIDELRGAEEIPAVVAGPHVLRPTALPPLSTDVAARVGRKDWSWQREIRVHVRGYPVTLWVRRLTELFSEPSRPPLSNTRTLVAVPSAPLDDDETPRLSFQLSRLQRRFGAAIAFASAGGHSRLFARLESSDGDEAKASDEMPIRSPLYRVPPGDSVVTISDIDLTRQDQGSPEEAEPPFRAVTVAPLIPQSGFPEYCDYLQEMRASGGGAEKWVLSQRGGWVRRRTLKRLGGEGSLRHQTFQRKLVELENSYRETGGLQDLQRGADPADVERLVDAVVLPSSSNSIWFLLESIRLSLDQLGELLPPSDAVWIAKSSARIDRLWAHYALHEVSVDMPSAPRPERLLERRIDLLQLATTLIQIEKKSKEVGREGYDFATGDELWTSIDAILGNLGDSKSSVKVLQPAMDRLAGLILRTPRREHPDRRSSREVSVYELASKLPVAEILEAVLNSEASESEDLCRLLDTLIRGRWKGGPRQPVEDLGSELALLRRRLTLQRAPLQEGDRVLSSLNPSDGLRFAKYLVGEHGRAIYLVSRDDPEEVLRGLLLELGVLYRVVRLTYRETLRGLAELSKEQRRRRLATRRRGITREGPILVAAVERLLARPEEHWHEVPEVFRRLRGLLEAQQEIGILALLGMLPEAA